jgi:hypothetical protein
VRTRWRRVPYSTVACPSGLRSTPRKRVRVYALRGFKTPRHRQQEAQTPGSPDRGDPAFDRSRLIVTRQGSGAFVRAQTSRPVELRPHIEAAFERSHVSIDFAGFSGETLRDALSEVLDKVRAGRLAPQSIAIRVMLSDTSQPSALPARAETQSDDAAVRERADRITRRAASGIIDQVTELGDLGLIPSVTVHVRVHGAAPLFKLYILNSEEAFFGFYPVVERTVTVKGEPLAIYDLEA